MQVGCFLVHVYHRRHDIFPAYPANEEVRRPLEERLYLLWGFPLEKLRAGSYQRNHLQQTEKEIVCGQVQVSPSSRTMQLPSSKQQHSRRIRLAACFLCADVMR